MSKTCTKGCVKCSFTLLQGLLACWLGIFYFDWTIEWIVVQTHERSVYDPLLLLVCFAEWHSITFQLMWYSDKPWLWNTPWLVIYNARDNCVEKCNLNIFFIAHFMNPVDMGQLLFGGQILCVWTVSWSDKAMNMGQALWSLWGMGLICCLQVRDSCG